MAFAFFHVIQSNVYVVPASHLFFSGRLHCVSNLPALLWGTIVFTLCSGLLFSETFSSWKQVITGDDSLILKREKNHKELLVLVAAVQNSVMTQIYSEGKLEGM